MALGTSLPGGHFSARCLPDACEKVLQRLVLCFPLCQAAIAPGEAFLRFSMGVSGQSGAISRRRAPPRSTGSMGPSPKRHKEIFCRSTMTAAVPRAWPTSSESQV